MLKKTCYPSLNIYKSFFEAHFFQLFFSFSFPGETEPGWYHVWVQKDMFCNPVKCHATTLTSLTQATSVFASTAGGDRPGWFLEEPCGRLNSVWLSKLMQMFKPWSCVSMINGIVVDRFGWQLFLIMIGYLGCGGLLGWSPTIEVG